MADIHPVVCLHFIGRHFNACNAIGNQNSMRKSDLSLDKFWVTHGGSFRLATIVLLFMGITYGKLLFYNGISEGSVDKKISTRELKKGRFMTDSIKPFQMIVVAQL